MPVDDALDKIMEMRATHGANRMELDEAHQTHIKELCKGWWQSPAGKEAIKNAK